MIEEKNYIWNPTLGPDHKDTDFYSLYLALWIINHLLQYGTALKGEYWKSWSPFILPSESVFILEVYRFVVWVLFWELWTSVQKMPMHWDNSWEDVL